MALSISPVKDDILTALRTFLQSLGLSYSSPDAEVEIIEGQVNRVPEPQGADFVVMTPLRQQRLSTNIDDYVDSQFLGFAVADQMIVTQVSVGEVQIGVLLSGQGVPTGTMATEQIAGSPGGAGAYMIDPPGTIPTGIFSTGSATFEQPTMFIIQVDVYGPNSWNNAKVITTVFQDLYGFEYFTDLTVGAIEPLYAEDPKQIAFIDAEKQFENRWMIEMALQANPVVSGIPQQFAGSLDVTLVEVETLAP